VTIMRTCLAYFGFFVFGVLHLSAQTTPLFIPQIADGGGWQTTLVVTNTTSAALSAAMTFHMETSSGNTSLWNLTFLESVSVFNLNVPAGATVFLHTPGAAAVTTIGWGQLDAPSGLSAYAIFRQRDASGHDQEGTAPATASGSRILVPFDNSAGAVTAIALANPSSSAQTIQVGFRNAAGVVSQNTVTVPPLGHLAVSLPQQFPALAGQTGLAEFLNTAGNFSLIALRFNAAGSFTAAPIYTQTGSPVILPSTGGVGTLPAFTLLSIAGKFTPTGYSDFTLSIKISTSPGSSFLSRRCLSHRMNLPTIYSGMPPRISPLCAMNFSRRTPTAAWSNRPKRL
jgi:hypothetical protein